MAWQRLVVSVKGEDPIEIETNARDWASISFDDMQTTGALFRVTHNALVRIGAPVPLNYDAFLEVLDGIPETADEGADDTLDPTPTDL
jgi:hypothetical protein